MVLSPSYSFPAVAEETTRGGIVLLLVFFLFLCEAQCVFGAGLAFAGVKPDFLLAAVVACGIYRGQEHGFWLGLTAGLFQDLASASAGAVFGHITLVKLLVGWLSGMLATSVRRSFILVPIVLIPLATIVSCLISSIFSWQFAAFQWRYVAMACVTNLVYGIPIYYAASFFPGRIRA